MEEGLGNGRAGLVDVAISDREAKIEATMKRAEKIQAKEMKADEKAIEETPEQKPSREKKTDGTDRREFHRSRLSFGARKYAVGSAG